MRFSFSPNDIIRLIRQRMFWFAIPFALLSIIGLFVISKLPPLYESRALLIVQGQQISDDIARSTVQSAAVERMELTRAEVMARDNIIRIGEQGGVFSGERLRRSEKHDLMSDRAYIDVRERTSRQRDASVITIAIGFKDPDPQRAYRVANELYTQFENKALEIRRLQAGSTNDFILEEEQKVRRSLQGLADKIAKIKSENPNALPDNRRLYESTIQRLLMDRTRTETEISSTQTQLQQLQMMRPNLVSNDMSSDERLLEDARRRLSQLRLQYQEAYPGIVALKRQILDLEREIDPTAFKQSARAEIAELSEQLETMQEGSNEYGTTEQRLSELKDQLANLPAGESPVRPGEVSYNGQVFVLESRLARLAESQEDLDRQIEDMEERIGALPAVESQLYVLEEEQDRLERDLASVQARRATAERALSIEQQAKAERTVAIERPVPPEEPTSPDKPKLALAVFALAAGIAGLLVLVPEVLFARVQSKEHLSHLLPDMPIIEVPRFKTADERTPKLVANASLMATTVVLAVALSWTAYQTLT